MNLNKYYTRKIDTNRYYIIATEENAQLFLNDFESQFEHPLHFSNGTEVTVKRLLFFKSLSFCFTCDNNLIGYKRCESQKAIAYGKET